MNEEKYGHMFDNEIEEERTITINKTGRYLITYGGESFVVEYLEGKGEDNVEIIQKKKRRKKTRN